MLQSVGQGLSPPTRENPLRPMFTRGGLRSIPAHAGEPASSMRSDSRNRVYPRPRGGTSWKGAAHIHDGGLSPPTRGNPFGNDDASQGRRRGSIPAHAGEPRAIRAGCCLHAVYPRPRGGTVLCPTVQAECDGLSPPTRGNRVRPERRQGSIPAHANLPGAPLFEPLVRSIPAHAGEPARSAAL